MDSYIKAFDGERMYNDAVAKGDTGLAQLLRKYMTRAASDPCHPNPHQVEGFPATMSGQHGYEIRLGIINLHMRIDPFATEEERQMIHKHGLMHDAEKTRIEQARFGNNGN